MERQDVSRAARTIRSLMRDKKYREVVRLAKSLRLDRINNGLLILDIVEAYEKLGEKKEAKNTLLKYYDVHGITGRNMMQKLIELCIETRDIDNAVGLCMEFENEWPESSISYLMRYQITTSAGGALEERIYYLEKYKEAEFEERWGYELAKLYDKNNQPDKCASVCHEIICFFGHGKYVEKAVQLKERVAGLTEDEIDILEAVKRREEEARIRHEEERLAREEKERQEREEIQRQEREEANRREEEQRIKEKEQLEREEIEAERRNREEARYHEERYVVSDESNKSEGQEEDFAIRKAREAELEKIRQTEEAARILREKKEEERNAREQKIAQVLKNSDRYTQVEKNKAEGIYFQEFSQDTSAGAKQKQRRNQSGGGGLFSSFGRVASDIRKTLQPDEDYLEDASGEIEYITVGRDSQAYVQDIEERMMSELDMLDDEQIDELTSEQIKEIYELKILRSVRENIKNLIVDIDGVYDAKTSEEELAEFVEKDPYPNPVIGKKEENEVKAETTEEKWENVTGVEREESDTDAFGKMKIAEGELNETGKSESQGTDKKPGENRKSEGEATEEGYKESENEIEEEAEKSESEAAEEKAEESERPESEMPEEKAEEPKRPERETAEEKAEEPKRPERETAEEKAEEPERPERETAEEKAEEPERPESEMAEEKAEEPKRPERETAEEKAEASERPERETAEEKAEEPKHPESETAEEKAEEPEHPESETAEEKAEEPGDPESEIREEKMEEPGDSESGILEEIREKEEKNERPENNITGDTREKAETPNSEIQSDETVKIEKKDSEKHQEELKTTAKETILDRIENPEENLTIKEFSECVTAYAETKGYQVEDTAYMTIAVLAEEMQQQNTPLSLNNAKKMTDDAIARIQKRNPLDKIMDRYSKKRAYLLKDRHFYWKIEKD